MENQIKNKDAVIRLRGFDITLADMEVLFEIQKNADKHHKLLAKVNGLNNFAFDAFSGGSTFGAKPDTLEMIEFIIDSIPTGSDSFKEERVFKKACDAMMEAYLSESFDNNEDVCVDEPHFG